MLEIIVQNKEIIKIFYGLIVTIICAIITLKTDRLFKISRHQGIRYFRNAFFFYGIAFIARYFLLQPIVFSTTFLNYSISNFIFEFFIIVGGFFLLNSLLWKNVGNSRPYSSSLFNRSLFVYYAMAIIIVLLDNIWNVYYFMFLSQIALFIFALGISYSNYVKKGRERTFLKFYFIAMFLSLITWILNAIAALYLNWNIVAVIIVYVINIIVFLLFLYGVVYVIKKD